MADFYESLPFLGPLAEWFAKAAEYAKKAGKESGQEYIKYNGYIVLDHEGEFIAYALVDVDLCTDQEVESIHKYIGLLSQHMEAVKAFQERYS